MVTPTYEKKPELKSSYCPLRIGKPRKPVDPVYKSKFTKRITKPTLIVVNINIL
jgi:hypothetical protein